MYNHYNRQYHIHWNLYGALLSIYYHLVLLYWLLYGCCILLHWVRVLILCIIWCWRLLRKLWGSLGRVIISCWRMGKFGDWLLLPSCILIYCKFSWVPYLSCSLLPNYNNATILSPSVCSWSSQLSQVLLD